MNKKKTDQDFFYLRTHNSVKDAKNIQYGLEYEVKQKQYIMSFNAFLFAGQIEDVVGGESAFARNVGSSERIGVMDKICNDICALYRIDNQQCRDEITAVIFKKLYGNSAYQDKYFFPQLYDNGKIILQIMFPKEKSAPNLQDLKKVVNTNLDLDNSYVSYDKNLVDFPDFYWAGPGQQPCTKGIYAPQYYQGSKMFHTLTSSQNEKEVRQAAKEAARSQLALIVTPKVLEKQITYDVIDIHNQFSQIEELKKAIHEESLSIIQKYQHTNQKPKSRLWGLFS